MRAECAKFSKHIFDKLQPLITAKISFVAVNTNKVGEEEVKYVLKDGYINQLSKTVKNGAGEAVGINFISSDDIPIFINRLEECDNNDYFERGLELAINKDDLKIKAVDISQYNCMEIDFIEDLENANNML